MTATLSVVVPTHGRPTRLARALDSLSSQQWPGLEVIVVDDNGADAETASLTRAVVAEQGKGAGAERPAMRYVANATNLGGAGSRNVGVAAAAAPIVAFLDDDDEWLIGHARAVSEALRDDTVDIVYCDGYVIDAARPGRRVLERHVPHAGDVSRQLLSGWCPSSTSLFTVRRSMLTRGDAARRDPRGVPLGPFDPTLQSFQDYDCWLTLSVVHGARFAHLPAPGVLRHRHAGSRITTRTAPRRVALERFATKWRERLDEHDRRLFAGAVRTLQASISRTEYIAALAARRPGAAARAAAQLVRLSESWPAAARSLARATLQGR